jgi:hypothetical protein
MMFAFLYPAFEVHSRLSYTFNNMFFTQTGLRVVGRIILNWISKKWNRKAWTGLLWLRIGTGGGACECGNEPSGSIKCG